MSIQDQILHVIRNAGAPATYRVIRDAMGIAAAKLDPALRSLIQDKRVLVFSGIHTLADQTRDERLISAAELATVEMKQCKTCYDSKPATEYYPYSHVCKRCCSVRTVKNRKACKAARVAEKAAHEAAREFLPEHPRSPPPIEAPVEIPADFQFKRLGETTKRGNHAAVIRAAAVVTLALAKALESLAEDAEDADARV